MSQPNDLAAIILLGISKEKSASRVSLVTLVTQEFLINKGLFPVNNRYTTQNYGLLANKINDKGLK